MKRNPDWSPPPARVLVPVALYDPAVYMLWGVTQQTIEAWLRPSEGEIRGAPGLFPLQFRDVDPLTHLDQQALRLGPRGVGRPWRTVTTDGVSLHLRPAPADAVLDDVGFAAGSCLDAKAA